MVIALIRRNRVMFMRQLFFNQTITVNNSLRKGMCVCVCVSGGKNEGGRVLQSKLSVFNLRSRADIPKYINNQEIPNTYSIQRKI